MLGYFLNLIYVLLLIAVSPVLLYRRITQGKYRDGSREKLLGLVPQRDSDRPCVWFHAVSVGEVLQLPQLIDAFTQQHPDYDVVVSTTTSTGRSVAIERLPQALCIYCPLDFTWAVRNTLRRLQPSLLVLVELELWPNLIRLTGDSDIPLALVNGRISDRSFRGYRRIRPLMKRLLSRFSILAMQSKEYADRIKALGAPTEHVHVTGSIKFDGLRTERDNSGTLELREFFGLRNDESVFVAGSTQSPEEGYALDTFEQLLEEFPNFRLVLVPRHQERFEEVAELITRRGFDLKRRSNAQPSTLNAKPVLLLDTLGELSACWGLADIAFVGGSLHNDRGGQNMMEPSAYAASVLFGPNTRNFRNVTQTLLSNDAARVVNSPEELTQTVRELLQSPDAATQQGERAREYVLSASGATARTIALLTEVICRPDAKVISRAA